MDNTKKMLVTLEIEYLNDGGRETPPNLWDWGAMPDLHPSERVSVVSWSEGAIAGNAGWQFSVMQAAAEIENNAGGRVTGVVVRMVAYKRTNNGLLVISGGRVGEKHYEHTGELLPVASGDWADYEELLLQHGDSDNLTHVAYSDSDINLAMLADILAAVYRCKIWRH